MKWFGRRRTAGGAHGRDTGREIVELFDPYAERTSVEELFTAGATFVPGKIIDNLRDGMERVILDPLVEISIVDFISEQDAALMFNGGFGRALIEATAEHGALLARRELPPDMAAHRIPAEFDLVTQFGLRGISPEMQQLGRELYNDACTTGSDVHLPEYAADTLDADQQSQIFITVLMFALVKLVNGIEELRKA